MMRRVVVAHESLRVVVNRDEEVFITMNERRMRRQFRRPLAFHILIIVSLVTVSSLWNAILLHRGNLSDSFTLQ
jgi:hypothetical protein